MHTVGERYEATRDERAVQIAARIRADIKAAIKAGELPRGIKARVRCSGSSLHDSIRVLIAMPVEIAAVENPEAEYGCMPGQRRLTVEAQRIRNRVRAIWAAYNYDNSDIQTDYFDVRYYGGVDIAGVYAAERWAGPEAA